MPACIERLAGPETYQSFEQKGAIVRDSPWQPRLDRIADALNRVAPADSGQRFRIFVLHDPVLNAFSVAGGDLYVYDGFLGFIASDEELQGSLCHEAAHALHHDMGRTFAEAIGTKRAAQTLSRYIRQKDNFFDVAAYLLSLRYSREVEEQADLTGSDLCAGAGFNPWGLVTMLRHAPETRDEFEATSDHPTNVHRIDALVAHFKAQPAVFGKWSDPGRAESTPVASGAAPVIPTFVDAYAEGVQSHRYVVVLFHGRGESASGLRAVVEELQRDPNISPYVVFGDGDVENDKAAYNYASRLHIAKLPTLSVLTPLPDLVQEVGRIEGFHAVADVRTRLLQYMCEASRQGVRGAPPADALFRLQCDGVPRSR